MAPSKGKAVKADVETLSQLKSELQKFTTVLSLPEDEHTWEKIEAAVQHFTLAIRGGACKFQDEFIAAFRDKDMIQRITNCLVTERTRLSGATLDMLSAATRLGPALQPLIPVYFPVILKLLARTNKLYISRASSCISAIIHNTHLPTIFPYIAEGMNDKSSTLRKGCAEAVLEALSKHPTSGGLLIEKEAIERRGALLLIEEVIKKAAVDKEVKIREVGRSIWNVYKIEWADRVEAFSAPLTPVMRKYLNLPTGDGRTSPAKMPVKPKVPSPLKSRKAPVSKPIAEKPRAVNPLHASTKENAPAQQKTTKPIVKEQAKEPLREVKQRPKPAPEQKAPYTSVLDDLFGPAGPPTISEPPKRPILTASMSEIIIPTAITPLPSPLPIPSTVSHLPFATAFSFLPKTEIEAAVIASLSPVMEGTEPQPTTTTSQAFRPNASRTASFKPKRAPGRAVIPPNPLSTSQTAALQPSTSSTHLSASSSTKELKTAPPLSRSATQPAQSASLKTSASKDDLKSSSKASRPPMSHGLQSKKEALSSSTSTAASRTYTNSTTISGSFKPKRPASNLDLRAESSASSRSVSTKSTFSSSQKATAPPLPAVPSAFAHLTSLPTKLPSPVKKVASPIKMRSKPVQAKKTTSSTSKKVVGSFFDRSTVASDAKAKEAREKRRKREEAMRAKKEGVVVKSDSKQQLAVQEEEVVEEQVEEEKVVKTPRIVDPASIPLPPTNAEASEISLPSPYLKEEVYSPVHAETFSPVVSPCADKQWRGTVDQSQQIFSFASTAQAFMLPLTVGEDKADEESAEEADLAVVDEQALEAVVDPTQIPLPLSTGKTATAFDSPRTIFAPSSAIPARFFESPSKASPSKRSLPKSVGRI